MKLTIDTDTLCGSPFRTNIGKLVWFCMLRDSGNDGVADISARSIAKEIGVSEKSVRNALSEMKQSGVIKHASPHLCPHESPHPARCLLRQITIVNSDICKDNYKEKNKPKSAQNSAPKSAPITNKSSSDALDFVDPAFRAAFTEWLDFKKRQFKFEYKTERSLNAAYTELVKLSGGDPLVAMEIVRQSESNGWKGLYELRNNDTKPITAPYSAAARKAQRDRGLSLANEIVASSENLLSLFNGGGQTNPDARED